MGSEVWVVDRRVGRLTATTRGPPTPGAVAVLPVVLAVRPPFGTTSSGAAPEPRPAPYGPAGRAGVTVLGWCSARASGGYGRRPTGFRPPHGRRAAAAVVGWGLSSGRGATGARSGASPRSLAAPARLAYRGARRTKGDDRAPMLQPASGAARGRGRGQRVGPGRVRCRWRADGARRVPDDAGGDPDPAAAGRARGAGALRPDVRGLRRAVPAGQGGHGLRRRRRPGRQDGRADRRGDAARLLVHRGAAGQPLLRPARAPPRAGGPR